MQSLDKSLTAWRFHEQRRRLGRLSATGAGRAEVPWKESPSEIEQRIDDLLTTERVAEAFRACVETTPDRDAEPARRRFRQCCGAFLDRASREADREREAVEETWDRPVEGFAAAVAGAAEPAERERLFRAWEEFEAGLEPLRRERFECRRRRAVEAGAQSLCEFLGAQHPAQLRDLLDSFRRGAVQPLDDAVSSAARDRRARSRLPGIAPRPQPMEAPLWESLAEYGERLPRERIRPLLAALGRALGADPDAEGPLLLDAQRPLAWSEGFDAAPLRGAVVIGTLAGPGGLRQTLAVFGRAARAGFLSRVRGAVEAAWGDPAFAVAAAVLFRRLPASETFLDWAGISREGRLLRELHLEEALVPRLAWAYLYLACDHEGDDPRSAAELLTRAAARPPTPHQLARVWENDPHGAAVLRGTVLAVLLEEDLMRRFGRRWFLDRSAGRYLGDIWEADVGETAESLSQNLGLGTIEPTPLLDRCRP